MKYAATIASQMNNLTESSFQMNVIWNAVCVFLKRDVHHVEVFYGFGMCCGGLCLFKTEIDGGPDVLIILMLNQCTGVPGAHASSSLWIILMCDHRHWPADKH